MPRRVGKVALMAGPRDSLDAPQLENRPAVITPPVTSRDKGAGLPCLNLADSDDDRRVWLLPHGIAGCSPSR